jgi:hypothetical protein
LADETEVIRILPADKALVEAEKVGKEPFPYALHRIIVAGVSAIAEAKKR